MATTERSERNGFWKMELKFCGLQLKYDNKWYLKSVSWELSGLEGLKSFHTDFLRDSLPSRKILFVFFQVNLVIFSQLPASFL